MAKREKMSESDIHATVARAVEAARAYDHDEVQVDNVKAIEYFNGEMRDVVAPRGESQAVSKDISDTISWLMPQVMRTLFSSDKVAMYEPRTPQDVEAASQATDYINFLALEECDIYSVCHDAIHDGFLLRNGYIKHWWDSSPDEDVATYSGISEDAAMQIASGDNVEVLEFSEGEPETVEDIDPQTGQPMQRQERRFAMKVKTTRSTGCLRVEAIPPEEFLIERGALSLKNARLVAHRRRRTRSDLIEEGYDRDKVAEIPALGGAWDREEETARHDRMAYELTRFDVFDEASEWVECTEAYAKLDANGDGVTEWVRVVMGGFGAGSIPLSIEEWDDELPFTVVKPDPVPHRFLGRSISDLIMDVQQQKTVVLRQMLQNIYAHNHPTAVVNKRAIKDQASLDALTTLGTGHCEVTEDPNTAVAWYQVPFVGDKCLAMLERLDQTIEVRTGMSRMSMGMSQDVLQNQTATAVSEMTTAAHAKLEHYCRNIVETGLKPLFRAIYKLIVQYQDRPRVIRLRDRFVEVDPRPWAAEMDVTVNVGLGTGSRDRDAAAIAELGMWGQNVLMAFQGDVNNPIFGLRQMREIGVMMAETRGLKAHERIIGGEDAIAQWEQSQAEAAEQPDPEMQKVQMEAQAKQQAAQMDAQLKQQELQQKAQLETAKLQQEAVVNERKVQADIEGQRMKMQAEIQMSREQMQAELALKREQMAEELRIKRELGIHQTNVGAATQIRVGGKPG